MQNKSPYKIQLTRENKMLTVIQSHSGEIINGRIEKFLHINRIALSSATDKVIFLDKYDYSCSLDEKICSFLTDEKKLIYFDGIHYTKKGAKYFGKIMHEISWLKPLDNHFKNK